MPDSQTLRVQAVAARLLARFEAAGAVRVTPEVLQPADVLLDLYGEDIRARAYVTHDPVRGEMMLRPDFTVPVVQAHMQRGGDARTQARYTYSGAVWRMQTGDGRRSEYPQVGLEAFGEQDRARADAAIFNLFRETLSGLPVTAVTGDMGLVFAAIESLDTSASRKAALKRHVWRPKRFARLLACFENGAPTSPLRETLFAAVAEGNVEKLVEKAGKSLGVRSVSEIVARAEFLAEASKTPQLAAAESARLKQVLELKSTLGAAPAALRRIAPALSEAALRLEERAAALAALGVDVDSLAFATSYGRTTMEYYDGFVFGFHANDADLPAVAQGGRYDAMTRVLGNGEGVPAIGGIVRPETVVQLGGDL